MAGRLGGIPFFEARADAMPIAERKIPPPPADIVQAEIRAVAAGLLVHQVFLLPFYVLETSNLTKYIQLSVLSLFYSSILVMSITIVGDSI